MLATRTTTSGVTCLHAPRTHLTAARSPFFRQTCLTQRQSFLRRCQPPTHDAYHSEVVRCQHNVKRTSKTTSRSYTPEVVTDEAPVPAWKRIAGFLMRSTAVAALAFALTFGSVLSAEAARSGGRIGGSSFGAARSGGMGSSSFGRSLGSSSGSRSYGSGSFSSSSSRNFGSSTSRSGSTSSSRYGGAASGPGGGKSYRIGSSGPGISTSKRLETRPPGPVKNNSYRSGSFGTGSAKGYGSGSSLSGSTVPHRSGSLLSGSSRSARNGRSGSSGRRSTTTSKSGSATSSGYATGRPRPASSSTSRSYPGSSLGIVVDNGSSTRSSTSTGSGSLGVIIGDSTGSGTSGGDSSGLSSGPSGDCQKRGGLDSSNDCRSYGGGSLGGSGMSSAPRLGTQGYSSFLGPGIAGGYGYGYGGGFGGPVVVQRSDGGGGLITILVVVAAFFILTSVASQFLNGGDNDSAGGRSSVTKLQVGLLGSARTLQRDLERIAGRADTNTPDGLHFVLQETVLALLRNPDYCVYGEGSTKNPRGLDGAEEAFNEVVMEERGKFKEETLVNVSGRSRRSSMKSRSSGMSELIVVTLVVAAEGGSKIPKVSDREELKSALNKLGALRSEQILAVEVMWTPQDEDDSYTKDELFLDYPTLNSL